MATATAAVVYMHWVSGKHFAYFVFLAQSSQVIQEGVVIAPISQMRKLRLGGLKTAQDLMTYEQEARSGPVLRRCCHGHGVAARRRWVPSTGEDRHCEARE